MTRFSAFPFVAVLFLTLGASSLHAQEFWPPRHDDQVSFDLSAEAWVTTKTARIVVNVEAAVSASNEGSMRAEMFKAVNALAKADWRLTSFDRSQDETGLERWSTTFEARLPESELGGLAEAAKKLGKAGMQLSVGAIDFSPTLEETEAARAALRVQIYKEAADQLAALNAAIPGRDYRIASIDFMAGGAPMPSQIMLRPPMPPGGTRMTAMIAGDPAEAQSPDERSQKATLTAHVVFAAAVEHSASMPISDKQH